MIFPQLTNVKLIPINNELSDGENSDHYEYYWYTKGKLEDEIYQSGNHLLSHQ